jgi:hypothetical protein
MFTLGFFVGIDLSPFGISVTLMTHHVKVKISLKSKHGYRLKEWIPGGLAKCFVTGSNTYFA